MRYAPFNRAYSVSKRQHQRNQTDNASSWRFPTGPLPRVIFILGLVWAGWTQRDHVVALFNAAKTVAPAQVPMASGRRFAVVLFAFEDDPDNRHQTLVRESLSEVQGIEVITLDRPLSAE